MEKIWQTRGKWELTDIEFQVDEQHGGKAWQAIMKGNVRTFALFG